MTLPSNGSVLVAGTACALAALDALASGCASGAVCTFAALCALTAGDAGSVGCVLGAVAAGAPRCELITVKGFVKMSAAEADDVTRKTTAAVNGDFSIIGGFLVARAGYGMLGLESFHRQALI